jgi:hypothetical protein
MGIAEMVNGDIVLSHRQSAGGRGRFTPVAT